MIIQHSPRQVNRFFRIFTKSFPKDFEYKIWKLTQPQTMALHMHEESPDSAGRGGSEAQLKSQSLASG